VTLDQFSQDDGTADQTGQESIRNTLELEKLKAEVAALKRPSYVNPALWISTIVALASIAGLLIQYSSNHDEQVLNEARVVEANAKVLEARNELHDARAQIDSLSKALDEKSRDIRVADSLIARIRESIATDRILSKQVRDELQTGLNLMYNDVDPSADSLLCEESYYEGAESTRELWLTTRGQYVLITWSHKSYSRGEGFAYRPPPVLRPVTPEFATTFIEEVCGKAE